MPTLSLITMLSVMFGLEPRCRIFLSVSRMKQPHKPSNLFSEFSPAPLVWFAFLALRVTIAKDIPSQGGSALVIA